MPITEFLFALQGAKKELLKPERMGFEERLAAAAKVARLLRSNFAELGPADREAALFSSDFYEESLFEASALAFERTDIEMDRDSFPSGLFSIRIESPFFLRLLCERIAPALMAGNALLVAVNPERKPLAEKIRALVIEAGFPPETLQILADDEEVGPFLLQHPGIRGASVFDPQITAQDLGPESWFEKKWQIHRGGKSTALVLADADLDQAVAGILKAVEEGQGTLSWNISRVIVLDSLEKTFLEKLANALAQKQPQLTETVKESRDRWVAKFKSQQARELVPGHPLAFLINVSNCSEEHQVELQAPIVFVMTVKYPHEMAKWINNLPNALGVQMWGSDEKIEKLAPKLEAARVWKRGWLEQDANLFYGVKSSIFGSIDGRAFGAFFSERRKLGDDPSKNSHWTE